jgi:fructokinase
MYKERNGSLMKGLRPKSRTPRVACLGEVLIDFIAKEIGTLNAVTSFHKYPGGAPANVAVGIARLGVASGFIGKVGADPFGEFLISVLEQNGVDTGGITQTTDAPTALAFVSRSHSGDRDFLFYRNLCADTLLTESDLPTNWLKQIQYLHIGGVSLTREPSRQATRYAAKVAKRSRAKISFDPNLRLDLWSDGVEECRSVVHSILEYTDLFLPSQDELLILMAMKDLNKALLQAHEMGPSIICVKMGPRGSVISEKIGKGDYRLFTQPPFRVNVVDTTGAGDAFDAGLIEGLVQGLSLKEAVLRGTAVASLVITQVGAMTALPTKTELERFLNESGDIGD